MPKQQLDVVQHDSINVDPPKETPRSGSEEVDTPKPTKNSHRPHALSMNPKASPIKSNSDAIKRFKAANKKQAATVSSKIETTNNDKKLADVKQPQGTVAPRNSSRSDMVSRFRVQEAQKDQPAQTTTTTAPTEEKAVKNQMTISQLAKQFSGPDFTPPKQAQEKSKTTKLQKTMYAMATAVFMFATFASIQTVMTNNQARDQLGVLGNQTFNLDTEGVSQGTGSEPAEEKVPDQAIINYQVSPELPRYIRIPDINVFARIKHTGIDANGAVDAPANIHDTSWFDDSATPGDKSGSSLILGHVQGWSGPGIFRNIDELQQGATFTVEKGSGETLKYEVTRTEEIPLDEVNMGQILSEDVEGEHDLKLMTCAGSYNSETETYESRFVVYSKIVR